MAKKPKHSPLFLFGHSLTAKEEARKLSTGKVLCEGCLEELASKIDEMYKFRYLLSQSQAKIRKQRHRLQKFEKRWKELREVLRVKAIPDVNLETNLVEHFQRWREK